MKILFYGLNYAPELTGIGKYSEEFCAWLADRGHDLRVISAPPYYPEWKVGPAYSGWAYRCERIGRVTVIRSPLFVPKQPTVLTRLLHLLSFAFTSFPVLLSNTFWKPDLIITVEPTFFCAPGALLAARLSRAKCILHIQDFELDAMLGLGMGKHGLIANCARYMESWLMRQFDAISSISLSMVQTAKQKISDAKPVLFFPNWVDIEFIRPYVSAEEYRKKWAISTATKVVMYSGNLGKKQGLELVLDTANKLQNHKDVLFLIVGAGAAHEELLLKSKQLKLTNVQFHPLQSYASLPALMALADIHLVLQKSGAADAVLPSKVGTILAAGGNSIITAETNTELGVLCTNYPGIARRIGTGERDSFADILLEVLAGIDFESRPCNRIARSYAEKYLDKESVLDNFLEQLNTLIL